MPGYVIRSTAINQNRKGDPSKFEHGPGRWNLDLSSKIELESHSIIVNESSDSWAVRWRNSSSHPRSHQSTSYQCECLLNIHMWPVTEIILAFSQTERIRRQRRLALARWFYQHIKWLLTCFIIILPHQIRPALMWLIQPFAHIRFSCTESNCTFFKMENQPRITFRSLFSLSNGIIIIKWHGCTWSNVSKFTVSHNQVWLCLWSKFARSLRNWRMSLLPIK